MEGKRINACCAEGIASITSQVIAAVDDGIYGTAWFGDLYERPEGRRS